VVVEFINGNPDWPLVTGCVYNDDNMPPEDLPASATRSTFKSRSVDGPATDFNEMRFEDKAGQEEVYVKAKKDMNLEVLEKFNIHVPNQTIPAVPSLQSATEGSDDSGTGSNITVTKDEITLVFANEIGIKSGIIINKDGIFLIGAPNIGVLCEGIVTITPIPIPRPSKAVLEAAGEMNMPPAFIAAMKLMP
jgi:type VI secretion system secreted protein VgrG